MDERYRQRVPEPRMPRPPPRGGRAVWMGRRGALYPVMARRRDGGWLLVASK